MNDSRLPLRQILRQYGVVLAAPFALLGPLLLRGQALFWGTPALQFVPWWVQAWESLRQGALPLWNPLNGMGAPLLANYQTAFFYPPNWILLPLAGLGGAAAVAWGFTVLAALHLAWGGLGTALLLRRLDFPWLGQVLGGLSFALSGYIVGRLGFFSMTWVYAWLPWVVLAADRLAVPSAEVVSAPAPTAAGSPFQRLRGWLPLEMAACAAMQLLAGHAQLTWYSLLLAGAWLVFRAGCRGGLRAVGRAAARMAVAGALAVGLAAVQLAPTLEYLSQSHRAEAVAEDTAMTYSFWPWRFISLFSPDFFGSPAQGNYWGYASYWEDHAYPGLLPLLLALATLPLLVRGLRRGGRAYTRRWLLAAFAWVAVALTFMLALGKFTPIFPFLYHNVPTFDMFQAPARWLMVLALLVPLLAAVGVEGWRCPAGRGLYWFRLATAGAFAVMLGSGLALVFLNDVRLTFIRATVLTGLWALGFGLLTLAIPLAEARGLRSLWQAAVIAWAAADLLLAGWSLNPGASLDLYRGASETREAVLVASGGQRIYLGFWNEYDLKFNRFLRFDDFTALEDWRGMRSVFLPNLNLLDGVPMANNFDPLVPERYARWIELAGALDPERQAQWLALSGVGAVERIDVTQPAGVRFDRVNGAARWRWFPCVQPVSGSEAAWDSVKARMDGSSGSLAPPVVEGAPQELTGECADANTAGQITLLGERPNRLELRVTAAAGGWLFTADIWYPGWRATVDGEDAQIYTANGAFRAVYIPAGSHTVIQHYRPFGFIFGGLSSILVFVVVIMCWTWRGPKRV